MPVRSGRLVFSLALLGYPHATGKSTVRATPAASLRPRRCDWSELVVALGGLVVVLVVALFVTTHSPHCESQDQGRQNCYDNRDALLMSSASPFVGDARHRLSCCFCRWSDKTIGSVRLFLERGKQLITFPRTASLKLARVNPLHQQSTVD
jgi:hypothetical protein